MDFYRNVPILLSNWPKINLLFTSFLNWFFDTLVNVVIIILQIKKEKNTDLYLILCFTLIFCFTLKIKSFLV